MRDDLRKRGFRSAAFVGREEIRRSLDAALDRAIKYESPQFVTLIGALGMGKTRVIGEWARKVAAKDRFRMVQVAGPVAGHDRDATAGTSEHLGLLAALLRARFGLDESADPDLALMTFRAELQQVFGDRRVAEVAGLLGRFLGFDLPESPLGQALATRPEQEVELARAVLGRFLEEDARRQPLLLVIDDLHLVDDRSLDVLEKLAGELQSAAIVIVVAAGSELLVRRPTWGRGDGSHARLELGPLSSLEMDVFMCSVLGTDSLASGLADRAAEESGGNPFLLEQLLRLYQAHGILVSQTGESWWFDSARAQTEVLPLSPEAAAQVRVAGLSAAEREVLSRGAAFGVTFWTGSVVALGRLGGDPPDARAVFAPDPVIESIRTMLADLADRDFLFALTSSTMNGETEWSFCHSEERTLILAGVDSELVRRRRRFAAQWIEARTNARPSSDRLELIGTLYEDGGDEARAGRCFVAAGEAASKRLRHERARALLLRGVRLLDLDDALLKLDACHSLGDVAARLGRAREALVHFHEMLRLSWRLDLPAKGGAAHARIGRIYRATGDFARAQEHLDLAHLLFDLSGDRRGIAATLDDIGRLHLLRGTYEEAAAFHRGALSIREELGDDRGRALTLSWLGLVELQRGNVSAASSCFHSSLALARSARDAHSIVFSLMDLGRLEREAGRPEQSLSLLEEARTLAREMGERLYECQIGMQVGDTLLVQGKAEAAELELRQVKEVAAKFGARRLQAEALRGLAEVRLYLGDQVAGRDLAYEALQLAENMGAPPLEATALRVLATAVANGAPGDPDRGGPREMFGRAVEVLEGLGAELELGRTLWAYAAFEESTGRDDAAMQMRTQAASIRRRTIADLTPPGVDGKPDGTGAAAPV